MFTVCGQCPSLHAEGLRPLDTDRLLVAVFLTQYSCLLQYMTEKMGGAEGTQMDVDFMDMERVNIIAVMLT
jgi:hypothetical protein